MHDIEPHFKWRSEYIASEDPASPFYGLQYDEFQFSQKVYNYYIHPQWDNIGSSTLYTKVLYANYDKELAILEMIGEWNDCLHNDVMFLKRNVIDHMVGNGINKFILICENVLSFHPSDDCYYEEWKDDIVDEGGWICFANLLPHVQEEMEEAVLHYHVNLGDEFNNINWRPYAPKHVGTLIEDIIANRQKEIYY